MNVCPSILLHPHGLERDAIPFLIYKPKRSSAAHHVGARQYAHSYPLAALSAVNLFDSRGVK